MQADDGVGTGGLQNVEAVHRSIWISRGISDICLRGAATGRVAGACAPCPDRRRVSTAVVQRFCKPKVGGSNPSPGTIPILETNQEPLEISILARIVEPDATGSCRQSLPKAA